MKKINGCNENEAVKDNCNIADNLKKIGIAKYIDHTLLKADATENDIRKLCNEAIDYGFASVCVNLVYIPLVHKILNSSGVKTCCVIGFPLGSTSTNIKIEEAIEAIQCGSDEIDVVLSIGMLKSGEIDYVKNEISELCNRVKNIKKDIIVKIIIETCLLSKAEIVLASQIVKESGADYVKTSTGFSTGGALEEDVRLIRETVGENMNIKASGGIRDYQTAYKMILAGANRLGCSNSIAVVEQSKIL